ncbi:hypothetical protein Q1695_000185 [Nippostrongylus brasiliensis]|nr:hypothetical protein Q1695_000185 [Nippostrongylus brasiliensis]
MVEKEGGRETSTVVVVVVFVVVVVGRLVGRGGIGTNERVARLCLPLSTIVNMDKQNDECSYCCLTLIALSIAFCSAVVTFLAANHMYTGLPCRDDPTPFAVKNEELSWNGSDRLVVASKRVIVVKLADTKRCYILPSRLAQDSPRKQFEIVPEPLSKAIGVHFAGQEGWNFCNSLPMYLLEESKSKPIELHRYKQNV